MKPLIHKEDILDRISSSITISDTIYSGPITSGVAKDITVPTGANIAIFSSTGTYYVKYNGSGATVPASFGLNGVEVNPTARTVIEGDVISIISPDNIDLSVAFYSA